jgi:hypothetical protein
MLDLVAVRLDLVERYHSLEPVELEQEAEHRSRADCLLECKLSLRFSYKNRNYKELTSGDKVEW